MRWKIYYGDGSTFSSDDGEPEEAPRLNVQIIIQDDPDKIWIAQQRADYYVWEYGRWWGKDLFGLWEHLFLYAGLSIALAGKTIGSVDYMNIWRAAKNDPMFGKKAAFARHETAFKELNQNEEINRS